MAAIKKPMRETLSDDFLDLVVGGTRQNCFTKMDPNLGKKP